MIGPPATSARIVRFGIFEVDLSAAELRKHGLRLKLSEQPFQILTMLLERPGEVITRDELRNRLWQTDTFVDFDHGLNNAVMRLREALGDSSDRPRFIETVPRRGYRFVAPIGEVQPSAQAALVDAGDTPLGMAGAGAQAQIAEASSPNDAPGSISRNAKKWLTLPRIAWLSVAVLAVALVSFVAVHYVQGMESAKAAHSMSLVVLPLENLSG